MISRLVVAICYGVVAFLVCYILGALLASVGGFAPLTTLGELLQRFAPLIGLVVAVLAFFGGASFPSFGAKV